MSTFWQVATNGRPLETIIRFFQNTWDAFGLDAFMLPIQSPKSGLWEIEIITDPRNLVLANPFVPVMVENTANGIQSFINSYSQKKLAALLRPCELTAWQTISSSQKSSSDLQLITFSTDCLGTFPISDYPWRAKRFGAVDILFKDQIKFSKIGGIAPYRLRIACQLCLNPVAVRADVNINFIGLPIEEAFLVSFSNKLSDSLERLDFLTEPEAQTRETHKLAGRKLIRRNKQTRERLSTGMITDPDLELDSLAEQLATCEDCQSCMASCPVCTNQGLIPGTLLSRQDIVDWMVSCVGCGMCEDHCKTHAPLVKVFAILRDKLKSIN